MKKISLLITALFLAQASICQTLIPDLHNEDLWYVQNREASKIGDDIVRLNGKEGDGMMVLRDFDFENGTLEFEVKGENKPGASFVGLAFNIQNEEEYETVYFRPFNFQNEAREMNSFQYAYEPNYSWKVLREKFPGKYENALTPAPNPDDWIHVRVTKKADQVHVYANKQTEPILIVDCLSDKTSGLIGLWVGNGSKGDFRNLQIKTEK